ncbi:MAG: hypothetical protein KF799_09595 [Bdellovibrionales bacterium]|nr:hypothetical protein [Bdellovibrionales bacterium]
MRLSFLILLLIANLNALQAAEVDLSCETNLLTPVDLALPGEWQTVRPEVVRHYSAGTFSFVTHTAEGDATVVTPRLKGIYFAKRTVTRAGQPLGGLGKTTRGRFVLLERFVLDAAHVRGLYIQNRLAQAGVAVAPLGLTKIKGEMFLVRPLVAGQAPLANWGLLPSTVTFAQVQDLETIAAVLQTHYPGYVNWGIIPHHSWRDRSSDADFADETLSLPFALGLYQFLNQIRFVATEDGRLLLERLPALVNEEELQIPYRVVKAEGDANWRFARWNWYRYLLAAQLGEDQKPDFYTWLKKKAQVEWQMRFQFLTHLIRRSPEFLARPVRMTGPRIGMLADNEVPFLRPPHLAFKDRKALRYHFKKHAAEMGLTEEISYVQSAEAFVAAPPSANRLYFIRKNGDIVLAQADASRMVVFSPEGLLRTYMSPSIHFHGHAFNSYYFYEQILKDEGFLE